MHPSVYTFREVRVPLWRYRAPVGIRGIDNDDNDSNSSNNNKQPSVSCKYILYVGLRYEVRARRVPPIQFTLVSIQRTVCDSFDFN